jgi:hypothetical protein
VRIRSLIEKAVELLANLACRHRAHKKVVSSRSVRDCVRLEQLDVLSLEQFQPLERVFFAIWSRVHWRGALSGR